MLNRRTVAAALQGLEACAVRAWERPLLCLAAGLLGGSAVNAAVGLPTPLVVGVLAAMGLGLLPRWPLVDAQRCCRVAFLGLALTFLHLGWQGLPLPLEHVSHKLSDRPERWHVEGVVDRAVVPRGDRQYVYLRLHRLQRQAKPWETVSGLIRINVHADRLPYLPGDVLRVNRLRLHRPRTAGNPGAFDFRGLMQRRGIHAVGGVTKSERLLLLRQADGYGVARTLERWRQDLRAAVSSLLPAPYDAVFLAIVLGHKGSLPAAVQSDFRAAGVAHLLVVSGLHVGFIAAATLFGWRQLMRTLRSRVPPAWLPRWRPTPAAAMLSLPPVLLYGFLVGWRVPTLLVKSRICAAVF